jgi:pimeloyl-ACP methyl ester carboxylesterase
MMPVLLLHGANTHAGVFDDLRAALPPGLGAAAIDFPGRGALAELQLTTIAARAAFVREAATALDRPLVVGHSLGAAVALELAVASPELVRGIVFCAAGTRFQIPPGQLEELRRLAVTGGYREPTAASFSPACSPEVIAKVAAVYRAVPAATALIDYESLVDWDGERDLDRLAVPMLIVRGADEYATLAAQSDALAARTGARSVVVPDAGHMLPVERPHELAAAIEAFTR